MINIITFNYYYYVMTVCMGDNKSVNKSMHKLCTMIRRAFSLFYLFIHFFMAGKEQLLPVTSRRRDCSIAALACSRIDFLL